MDTTLVMLGCLFGLFQFFADLLGVIVNSFLGILKRTQTASLSEGGMGNHDEADEQGAVDESINVLGDPEEEERQDSEDAELVGVDESNAGLRDGNWVAVEDKQARKHGQDE